MGGGITAFAQIPNPSKPVQSPGAVPARLAVDIVARKPSATKRLAIAPGANPSSSKTSAQAAHRGARRGEIPADGYKPRLRRSGHSIVPFPVSKLQYDVFTISPPISLLGQFAEPVPGQADSPMKSLADLMALVSPSGASFPTAMPSTANSPHARRRLLKATARSISPRSPYKASLPRSTISLIGATDPYHQPSTAIRSA